MSNGEDIIDEFIKYCKSAERVAIYGAGAVGKMVYEFLCENLVSVYCFAVTGIPEESYVCGVPVRRIDDIHKNAMVIIATSKKTASIIYGYALDRFTDVYYDPELLYQLYLWKCRIAIEKVVVSDDIIDSVNGFDFDREYFYIVCPASIGDTLYVASLIGEFKQHINYGRVCLIVKPQHVDVVNNFLDVDNVVPSDEIVDTLDLFTIYTQTFRLRNYLYGHFKKDRRLEIDPEYYQDENNNILTRYRKLILGIDSTNPLNLLKRWNISNNDIAFPKKKDGREDIVIMPYAKSAPMLSKYFWSRLVERLITQGLRVYTNTDSRHEGIIEKTEALSGSIMETVHFCNSAQNVISIRSGMCDALGFFGCNMMVLNTSKEMSEKWDLNELWGDERIKNIDTVGKSDEAIIDLIMRQL